MVSIEEQHATRRCVISDLQWNTAIPQLILATYCKKDKKEDNFIDYPGINLI